KHVRAEPIAALYEQGRVHHVGTLPALEDELAAFTTAGYIGAGAPNRANALGWSISDRFPRGIAQDRATLPDPKALGHREPPAGYIPRDTGTRNMRRRTQEVERAWRRPWGR